MPPARNYRVIDQFSRAIQERQRKFVPYLIQARKDDKKASRPLPEMLLHGHLGILLGHLKSRNYSNAY
ncbi:hypothetical protein DPMN_092923 [Dreissena polymorpha]|uniref:Uncharacterized protein n=1 Tax=Dreissena polymorpha TaxID=45954 RepID=A0A9D4L4V0_DREPO|nr:hypothetical protein DPMN_092923 [Dreissena polymorpha]